MVFLSGSWHCTSPSLKGKVVASPPLCSHLFFQMILAGLEAGWEGCCMDWPPLGAACMLLHPHSPSVRWEKYVGKISQLCLAALVLYPLVSLSPFFSFNDGKIPLASS